MGFVVIGVALLAIGIYDTYERLDFLGRCLETRAVVVDTYWEENYDPDTGPYQVAFPVFQFVDQRTGEQINATGSAGGPSPAYSVGEEVDILYNPADLDARVIVKSFWDLWLFSIVLLPMGSMLTIVGIYTLRKIV